MIENPNRIDVFGVRVDGGADLLIVSAGALDDSADTQTLLLDKIETYLKYINSKEFQTECPNASTQNTHIILQLSENPPQGIIALADKIRLWVAEYNATFRIRIES